eukprot:jgi/Mesvir1/21228/Mv06664-RA.1
MRTFLRVLASPLSGGLERSVLSLRGIHSGLSLLARRRRNTGEPDTSLASRDGEDSSAGRGRDRFPRMQSFDSETREIMRQQDAAFRLLNKERREKMPWLDDVWSMVNTEDGKVDEDAVRARLAGVDWSIVEKQHNEMQLKAADILGGIPGILEDMNRHQKLYSNRVPSDPAEYSEDFQYDMLGIPEDDQAARLSEASKKLLYELHTSDPEKWTHTSLADKFQISEQRVVAIIALKKIEKQRATEIQACVDAMEPEAKAKYLELAKQAEECYNAPDEVFGVGLGEVFENWKVTQGLPDMTALDEDEWARYEPGQQDAALRAKVKRAAAMVLEEFKDRVSWNLQQMFLPPRMRNKRKPSRPATGWSYVVRVLDRDKRAAPTSMLPFVIADSKLGGQLRKATPEEVHYMRRKAIKRRTQIL